MLNAVDMTENTKSEFYPTPEWLVDKMLDGVDLRKFSTILEPSAGKGDILKRIARKENILNYHRFDVDCIEIDPNLRQILKYNFSEEKRWKLKNEKSSAQFDFFTNDIHIVHDDFLTFRSWKKYDLIIMNPPFSNGDLHLLKALDMQKNGGNIICLLNAETIRNPYTEKRKELVSKLNTYNAKIEFIENAFGNAERQARCDVALIKVSIENKQEESDIFERLKKAEGVDEFNEDCTDVEITDFIKSQIVRFNVEVQAGLELIRQYKALTPYILNSFTSKYSKPLISLEVCGKTRDDCVNAYVKGVRRKYWQALLQNPKFIGRLTSKLQDEYRTKVETFADYDFSEYNILTLSNEITSQIKTSIEDSIVEMFDNLTVEYSYYPETQKNKHYYNGWTTNKAHKINKRVILPFYNAWSYGHLYDGNVSGKLCDIERILNFLDGGMTRSVESTSEIISRSFECSKTKNIHLKYFDVSFYKKGTAHITFNCPELIERFNIYAAQYKKWLPPSYGKKKYKDLNKEEKEVVDSFQGESEYNNILAKASYYLAPVVNNQILAIEGA